MNIHNFVTRTLSLYRDFTVKDSGCEDEVLFHPFALSFILRKAEKCNTKCLWKE